MVIFTGVHSSKNHGAFLNMFFPAVAWAAAQFVAAGNRRSAVLSSALTQFRPCFNFQV